MKFSPKYPCFSLNITKIKLIALVTMLIDHTAIFIPNIPFAFRVIGRISAPLFVFSAVEAFYNTSCKKKYILRLYILNLIMGFINFYLGIEYNFVRTILVICIIIYIHEDNRIILSFIFVQLLLFMIFLFLEFIGLQLEVIIFINTLLVGVLNIEGGLIYVMLGFVMYNYRNKRFKFIVLFVIFITVEVFVMNTDYLFIMGRNLGESAEVFYFVIEQVIGVNPLYLNNITSILIAPQWTMLVSLIIILLYNGSKGKGCKYLFYIFYPIHILVLYCIKCILEVA